MPDRNTESALVRSMRENGLTRREIKAVLAEMAKPIMAAKHIEAARVARRRGMTK